MERPLTQNFPKSGAEPLDLRGYEKAGGYQALRKALTSMTPDEVISVVTASNLLGRGGAGFPTGKKWSFVPKKGPSDGPRYLVCNADEMEPGTFKDRFLIENDPHQLLEGMILASFAVQATSAYVFLRGEYTRSADLLTRAIREAYAAKLLGSNIAGSKYSLDLHLHLSAGRYICGEETALLNSLEGGRANPRAKPPFPVVAGLWGRPTVVNNVETLCNVPHIVTHGPEWFRSLSLTGEGGTKIYGVSGKVNRPGAWELPLGTRLRDIIEDSAQGMKPGLRIRGVIPGGVSTEFLVEEHLDTPMDFASVSKSQSRLGTGTMIVLDDQTCPVGFISNTQAFFARESCGWCTPCREGLPWVAQLLERLEKGTGTREDLDLIAFHAKWLAPGGHTFCPLAPGAMAPLASGLKYFVRDFESHIGQGCPRS